MFSEQYTSNAMYFWGVELPSNTLRDLYTSGEDVVIKLSVLYDKCIWGKNADIAHKIYRAKNKLKNIYHCQVH